MCLTVGHPFIDGFIILIRYAQCRTGKPFTGFINLVDADCRLLIFHCDGLYLPGVFDCKLHRIGGHIPCRYLNFRQCVCMTGYQPFNRMRLSIRHPLINHFPRSIRDTQCCTGKPFASLRIHLINLLHCRRIAHLNDLHLPRILHRKLHRIGCCITIRHGDFRHCVSFTNNKLVHCVWISVRYPLVNDLAGTVCHTQLCTGKTFASLRIHLVYLNICTVIRNSKLITACKLCQITDLLNLCNILAGEFLITALHLKITTF